VKEIRKKLTCGRNPNGFHAQDGDYSFLLLVPEDGDANYQR
jgi:hypothetical protein